ncbi:MAG TPA: hypothetical protein VFT76_02020 [Actinomycetota bacterium]|nr:hypothetical protein [Actinomycetota bacterium]
MIRRDVLQTIAIFVLVVAALVLPAYALVRINQVQLDVGCLNAESNIASLKAIQQNGIVLRRTARELGLPAAFPPIFEVPELPEECR